MNDLPKTAEGLQMLANIELAKTQVDYVAFPALPPPTHTKQDLTQVKLSSILIDTQHTICGVPLKPLCLGHIILLESCNNPLISKDTEDVEQETGICYFFLALLICSLSYEDGMELLNDKDKFNKMADAFIQNLTIQMQTEANWNIFQKLALYKNYMSEFLESMPYYENTSTNKDVSLPSGNDWKTGIMLVFKKLGYTDSQILNMSMKRLFATWASYSEAEGQIKICNKYEAETLKRFEQARKKK